MSEPVKSTRRYESPRRREQAAATRREILESARRLFARQGYAATTMAAIAAEAGVALKTVYVAFETKAGVLRALWNVLLRGDEGDAPVAEREWYRAVLDEPDPERQLRMNATNSRIGKLRFGDVLEVIRPERGDLRVGRRRTSSGWSTTRTSGSSSSAGSAGRQSSTSSGAPTPCARSSCPTTRKAPPRRGFSLADL